MTNALSERVVDLPDELRPWITRVGVLRLDTVPKEPFVHLPDADTKVVVRVEGDGRRSVLVVGPRVRATYHAGKPIVSCVEVRLAPGTTLPLLGVPAVDLVGRAAFLGDLPGKVPRQLAAELLGLDPDPESTTTRLAEILPARLSAVADPSRTELVRAGVDAMSIRTGRLPGPVPDVARELAVSERQLRNLFAEGVGLSPKHYARINRVRAVLAHATELSWAQLAAVTGYYDQSHMTSDFRALMGVPPRSYFTGRLPEAMPCRVIRRG
ncbi:helix-turn-helix domain-containing protein [Streptomyces sp. NBC_01239]|uniref:AraC family transcriptional regulator n=1 Tax=Streptomyces sp. NBC_01239 TaxID=2903792 RepID=UPI00224E18D9|nr:helix-turn-helix domain-containing protein [Streptomyces sp. NBC_01239]MCX4814837.1 helix-turn-helix domain-containing protein [Streptomyces sp. NBC_01239]